MFRKSQLDLQSLIETVKLSALHCETSQTNDFQHIGAVSPDILFGGGASYNVQLESHLTHYYVPP